MVLGSEFSHWVLVEWRVGLAPTKWLVRKQNMTLDRGSGSGCLCSLSQSHKDLQPVETACPYHSGAYPIVLATGNLSMCISQVGVAFCLCLNSFFIACPKLGFSHPKWNVPINQPLYLTYPNMRLGLTDHGVDTSKPPDPSPGKPVSAPSTKICWSLVTSTHCTTEDSMGALQQDQQIHWLWKRMWVGWHCRLGPCLCEQIYSPHTVGSLYSGRLVYLLPSSLPFFLQVCHSSSQAPQISPLQWSPIFLTNSLTPPLLPTPPSWSLSSPHWRVQLLWIVFFLPAWPWSSLLHFLPYLLRAGSGSLTMECNWSQSPSCVQRSKNADYWALNNGTSQNLWHYYPYCFRCLWFSSVSGSSYSYKGSILFVLWFFWQSLW